MNIQAGVQRIFCIHPNTSVYTTGLSRLHLMVPLRKSLWEASNFLKQLFADYIGQWEALESMGTSLFVYGSFWILYDTAIYRERFLHLPCNFQANKKERSVKKELLSLCCHGSLDNVCLLCNRMLTFPLCCMSSCSCSFKLLCGNLCFLGVWSTSFGICNNAVAVILQGFWCNFVLRILRILWIRWTERQGADYKPVHTHVRTCELDEHSYPKPVQWGSTI